MANWLDNVLNVNRVGQRGSYEAPKVSFTGGEEVSQTGQKGWEKYHNGQGPNGLKAYPDEFSGHKFNAYF